MTLDPNYRPPDGFRPGESTMNDEIKIEAGQVYRVVNRTPHTLVTLTRSTVRGDKTLWHADVLEDGVQRHPLLYTESALQRRAANGELRLETTVRKTVVDTATANTAPVQATANTATASTAPASTATASTAPASTAPASTAPASTAPASGMKIEAGAVFADEHDVRIRLLSSDHRDGKKLWKAHRRERDEIDMLNAAVRGDTAFSILDETVREHVASGVWRAPPEPVLQVGDVYASLFFGIGMIFGIGMKRYQLLERVPTDTTGQTWRVLVTMSTDGRHEERTFHHGIVIERIKDGTWWRVGAADPATETTPAPTPVTPTLASGDIFVDLHDARFILTSRGRDRDGDFWCITRRHARHVSHHTMRDDDIQPRVASGRWRAVPEPELMAGDTYESMTRVMHRLLEPLVDPRGERRWRVSVDGKVEQQITHALIVYSVKSGSWRLIERAATAGGYARIAIRSGTSSIISSIISSIASTYLPHLDKTSASESAYEARLQGFRCPRCRALGGLVDTGRGSNVKCMTCHGTMPETECIDERAVKPERPAREEGLRYVEQLLVRDARHYPDFAEPRRAAVMAAYEKSGRQLSVGATETLLANLHEHEATRPFAGPAPMPQVCGNEAFQHAWVAAWLAYERARTRSTELWRERTSAAKPLDRRTAIQRAFAPEQDVAKVFGVKEGAEASATVPAASVFTVTAVEPVATGACKVEWFWT